MEPLNFRVLGPLELRRGERPVDLTCQQRALLAALLVDANRAVPTDRLAEALWGENLPAAAPSRVRTLISDLRRVCDADRILTASRGYLVRVRPGELDADVFATTIDEAREASAEGRLEDAKALFDAALGLWHGEPAWELAGTSVCAEVSRLCESWRAAMEARAEVKLTLGLHSDVISEMRRLAAEHPLCERPHALLMLALQRGGRLAEALAVYRDLHARFVDELGIEPSADLRDLNRNLLTEEPGPAVAGSSVPVQVPVPVPVRRRSPCLLPADTADFVGRTAEIEAVTGKLCGEATAPPIASIWGMPGTGKTALALHVAHALRPRFPDGQLFACLRGSATPGSRRSADVLAEFLRALGADGAHLPESADERAAMYRDLITDRRVLVVLDDAQDEAQVEPLLPGTPGCAVLVTSRFPLLGLPCSCTLRLDVLPEPDARVLLGAIAGRERVDADPVAVGELLHACGGRPLAVRIAGGRLAMHPHR
ncbi:BTAD domain-containing putative transcriptional regulator [Actinomadura sp. 1N219]|uniref:AfsR/SARP family transcriptional regulator n=1 Tax=Actinomadura sp. 1N219 TaxID=3375152 RepID=UPI0037B31AF5